MNGPGQLIAFSRAPARGCSIERFALLIKSARS
jgi:hypothetical protein